MFPSIRHLLSCTERYRGVPGPSAMKNPQFRKSCDWLKAAQRESGGAVFESRVFPNFGAGFVMALHPGSPCKDLVRPVA